jgi:hypothetical protein
MEERAKISPKLETDASTASAKWTRKHYGAMAVELIFSNKSKSAEL